VALNASIVALLKRERIPYTCFRHSPAYTAQEEAAVSHVLGRYWAKVVICIADDQPVQAVLPAHHTVDLEQLRVLANARSAAPGPREEIAELYPDYEVGAMPPFGSVHGHRVFIDRCLVENLNWCSTPARTPKPCACTTAISPNWRSLSWACSPAPPAAARQTKRSGSDRNREPQRTSRKYKREFFKIIPLCRSLRLR
jgi:Ala-tRNA(Pro) deacylase